MNHPDTSSNTFVLPLPPFAMFSWPEEFIPEITIFASVVPVAKFTSDVEDAVLPAYAVRYPPPVPPVAVRLPATAVAPDGMLASPVTCTVMDLPAWIALRLAFADGRFSLEQ